MCCCFSFTYLLPYSLTYTYTLVTGWWGNPSRQNTKGHESGSLHFDSHIQGWEHQVAEGRNVFILRFSASINKNNDGVWWIIASKLLCYFYIFITILFFMIKLKQCLKFTWIFDNIKFYPCAGKQILFFLLTFILCIFYIT